ncbi:hypothetical protein EZV62_002108 [Acer yangbiense]|uniref:Retrotransposon gag domain-containing protein n=1 Tax=Acer yangbiense TaxID=1000413 RepID=A0A5C7IWR1_9ROSI|nr:hypothetical protein EZV62_002108 [Acer yangbiense]
MADNETAIPSDNTGSATSNQIEAKRPTSASITAFSGKLGYITGELPTPPITDPTYKTWLAENSIVLAWLINSMEPKISCRYLYFKTAKEVWDVARRIYLDLGNASQIFKLHSKLKEMKQGSNSVTQYFSDLQDLWQELNLFFEEDSSCAKCSIKQQCKLENERIYDFITGLNWNLDEICGQVVARDPFPLIEEAFAEVHREEGRRKDALDLPLLGVENTIQPLPPLPTTSSVPNISSPAPVLYDPTTISETIPISESSLPFDNIPVLETRG